MRAYLYLVASFLFSICGSPTTAQTAYHISTGNGLSTNNMTTVIRAKDNYMWIGSYNGLHKHEGSGIRIFSRQGKDSISLSSGEMHTVYEDRLGFIWAGTTGGLDKIDPRTNLIEHIGLRAGDRNSAYLGYIYSVFQDSENFMWVSADAGLFRMNYTTREYRQIPISKKDGSGVPSQVLAYKGGISTEKGVWMHSNEGLIYYEYATKQFYHRFHNPKREAVFNASRTLAQPSASELCSDKKGNLYFVNSNAQLVRYNAQTAQLDSFSFQHPAGAWKCCYALTADRRGNIWIGFRHGGLLFFHSGTQTFQPVVYRGINSLVQSNYIYSIAEDYQGGIWIATNNGVDIIDWYNRAVKHMYLSEAPKFQQLNYPAGMMSYDHDHFLYIPFFSGGLFRFDTRDNTLQHFRVKDTAQRHVSFADAGNNGSLWLGNTKSLAKAMLNDSVIRYSALKNPLAQALQKTTSSVAWMLRGNEQSVYIKKVNGSIYHFTATDSLERIPAYGFMKQMNISKDSQYLLYINPALNVVRRHLRTLKHDTIDINKKLLSARFLYFNPRDLVDDGNGNIWIASQNGVIRYDVPNDSIHVYTTAHGLANNFTYALCADKKKRVWVASLGGVDWFDAGMNAFKNVATFSSSTYMDSYGSALETGEGILFFLAGNKLLRVDPGGYFSQPAFPWQLSINELQVNGKTTDLADAGKLHKLGHRENRLLFRFGLLNFARHNGVKYYYFLEGIEHGWIENAGGSSVSYNALPPGRFTFHVKATDASGIPVGKEQAISFRIMSPFWEAIWFRLLVLGLMVLVAYLMYSHSQRKRREKERQKLLMAESRFMNLRLQMNPHFLFNSLNSIQHLVVSQQPVRAYQYLTVFSHLLRSVLQNAEKDFISLDAELQMLKMYLDLEAMRFKESFDYEIIVDENLDQEEVMVPSLLVQPFAENAIWHGLLNKQGDKKLTIAFSNGDAGLTCKVKDNGIGREKAAEFNKQQTNISFYQSKGIRIVKERLVLLQQRTGKPSGITITDLYNESDPVQAEGTLVEIKIPFYYAEET